LSYDILIDMTENGLLHPDYNCWHYYGPYGFTHQGLRWGLVPKGDPKAPEIKMKGAKFTTCGVELLKIVDIEPLPAFTTKMIKHFSQSGYDMVKAKS
ncbi:MAG: hypothetical protein OXC91_12770, partial [Rhodobacteraceae bacterium]|nr:hypothetical protein [Paracoccaceae bacterium]